MNAPSHKRRPVVWSGLFALALAIAIALGSGQPIYSQSSQGSTAPLPLTQQDVLENVRDLARQDVDQNDPQRTPEDVLKWFEDQKQQVRLTNADILDAYEAAYSEADLAQPQNVWDIFDSDSGPLVLIIGTLVGIVIGVLKDTITAWISGVFTAIDAWIYARYSGTELFRDRALRQYRQELFEKYKDLNIPFRTHAPPLAMKDVYVPLKVSGGQDINQIDAGVAIATYPRLMVKGPPGSGKSMLLKHIALKYGDGSLVELPKRPVVLLLELHRVNEIETQDDLIGKLVAVCDRNGFPNAERFVRQSLESGTLLLLLDGLDEVNSDARDRVSGVIRDLLDTHEDCRAIITCRTAVYRDEFNGVVDQSLEVVELSDQQIRQFLYAWKEEFPPEKSIDQLMELLRNRPQIMALVKNPLLLTIVAHLYTNPLFELPRSRAEFYQESTRILLEQRHYKGADDYKFNQYQTKDKRQVLQQLALYNQTRGATQSQDRRSMGYKTVLAKISQVLPSLTLEAAAAKPILDEIEKRSGLFMEIDGGERYQFAHLTLQEYFVAVALVGNEAELIQRFEADMAAWREVVKLWCGLAADSTTLIEQVYTHDPITGFECLADAQKVDQALATQIIDEQKQALVSGSQNVNVEALVKAFGIVAADSRERGKGIFQYLQAVLADSSLSSCHELVANALASTYLPNAASGLATHYETIPTARAALIKMGDLAVPALLQIPSTDVATQKLILDDLFKIGTPDAALALASFIWELYPSSASVRAVRSAWYIAALLPQQGIEDTLQQSILPGDDGFNPNIKLSEQPGGYGLAYFEDLQKRMGWIWAPFEQNLPHSRNALPVVLARVADLVGPNISNAVSGTSPPGKDVLPKPLPKVDPRLAIPLCAIHFSTEASQPQKLNLAETWTSEAEALLQTPTMPQLSPKIRGAIQQALGEMERDANPLSFPQWKILLSTLDETLQFDLLHRLITRKQPTRGYWEMLGQKLTYDFRTGSHYWSVLVIAALTSITALVGMVVAVDWSTLTWLHFFCGISIVVIAVFWATVYRGTVFRWEPNLFEELGPKGLLTFGAAQRRLILQQFIWVGIDSLYETITDSEIIVFTGAFAIVFAGAFAIIFADAFAIVEAFVVIGSVPIAVGGAFTGAGMGVEGGAFKVIIAIAFVFTIAVAFAFTGGVALALVITIGGIFVIGGAVAGTGIGAWYRLIDEPAKKHLHWLTLLAFPWFCWFPIVVIFNFVVLHKLTATYLSSPTWVPWVVAAGVELTVFLFARYLWETGKRKEMMAQNPFHGGILEEALRIRSRSS